MIEDTEILEKLRDDAIILEGPEFNKAIVGYSEEGLLIYDYDKLVEVVIEQEDCDMVEAWEWVDYNIIGISGAGTRFIILNKCKIDGRMVDTQPGPNIKI